MTREQVGNLVLALAPVMATAMAPLLLKRGRELYLGAWRGVRSRITTAGDRHKQVMAKLGDVERRVERVESEVTDNHGGSTKDAIKRTEAIVTELRREGKQQRARLSARSELKDRGQFEAGIDGAVQWTNEALRFYAGQPESVIHGRHWLAMFDRADRERLEAEVAQIEFERASTKIKTMLRHVVPATDTGGGRVNLVPVEVSVSIVPEPDDQRQIHCYSFTVRKLYPTGQQAAFAGLNLPSMDEE